MGNKKNKKHNRSKSSNSSTESTKKAKKAKTSEQSIDTLPEDQDLQSATDETQYEDFVNSTGINESQGTESASNHPKEQDLNLPNPQIPLTVETDNEINSHCGRVVIPMQQASNLVQSTSPILYPANFKGPCLTHVFDNRPGENIGNFHPMSFGKKLLEAGFTPKSIHPVGKLKVAVTFNKYNEANDFILNIKERLHPSWVATVDESELFNVGIIYDVDPQLSEQQVLNGMTGEHAKEIDKVIRITRVIDSDSAPVSTNTDKVKIYCKAPIPPFVYIYFNFRQISQYIPPILRCRKCQQYGHSTNYCPNGLIICVNCSFSHPDEQCSYPTRCANCKLPHAADDKTCMHFLFHKKVAETRVKLKCSRKEAIFRVKQREQALACKRSGQQSDEVDDSKNSHSSYADSDLPDNSRTYSPLSEARIKQIGKRYASKCVDQFVKSLDPLFADKENQTYQAILNLGEKFAEEDIDISLSPVNSPNHEN